MILNDIIAAKRRDLEEMKRRFPLHRLREATSHKRREDIRPFRQCIDGARGIRLICEIKKASPSQGVIARDFQPLRIAGQYEFAGASAISVLTEPHYFKGRPSYLKTVRQVTTVPLLRKDFILETYQIYETALLEADAFLLIASILTDRELSDLIELGRQLALRLVKSDRRSASLAVHDVSERIVHALHELCTQPDAMTHPDGMQIRITRQELGRLVGCSREMAGRVLKQLERERRITAHGKTIVVFGTR